MLKKLVNLIVTHFFLFINSFPGDANLKVFGATMYRTRTRKDNEPADELIRDHAAPPTLFPQIERVNMLSGFICSPVKLYLE